MLTDTTIPADRAWNSWSTRPAEMIFLPLGLRITPVAYSTRARKASLLPPETVAFGPHPIDGDGIGLSATLGGSSFTLAYAKPDPFTLTGTWKQTEAAEWAQRFWFSLCLSAEDGTEARWDAEAGAALVSFGHRHVALVPAETPVQVSAHESPEDLAACLEEHGYWHIGARGTRARCLALRFSFGLMPEGRFAAAVADSPDLAVEKARAALAGPAAISAPDGAGDPAPVEALAAIRDILGWNTVWDPVNRRPYTAVSRIWPLGEFAVWFNDQSYAALLAGITDDTLMRANLDAMAASATPQGNYATILTSHDAWVDRSQPPMGAFMLWLISERSGDPALAARHFDALAANQRWWRRMRDPEGRGLVSCGTSDVGESQYKGTFFGACNETAMDNSATHDEAVYDPATRTLSTFDLGLNCALALDAEMLARLATRLGRGAEAREFDALAADSRMRIRTELWDPERRIFANRQRTGGFVQSLSPTSFYPLLCGAADAEQARALLGHLEDPALFGGQFPLPNASRSDPAYAENTYWRGRIWPNVSYMVWQGLRRYGFDAAAARLAGRSWEMFRTGWAARLAGENYSAETGEIRDAPDTDPFYTWAAMLAAMALAGATDVSPWEGWTITHDGPDMQLGPVLTPAGALRLDTRDGRLRLLRGETPLLETGFRGRLTRITLGAGGLDCRLWPAEGAPAATLSLPGVAPGRLVAALLDGAPLEVTETGDGLAVTLGPVAEGARLEIHLRPAGPADGL